MTSVEASIEIDAPREDVWDVVADPRNLPRWDRRIVAVHGVPNSGLREGSRYAVELRFMGARARSGVTVIELRPPEYSRARLDGMIEGTVETTLEAAGRGRTRLRHVIEYRFRGGALGVFASRAVQMLGASSLVRRGVLAQKRQVEDRVAST